MGNFKQYLAEGEQCLADINSILNDMDSDEIDEFGAVLYDEFFDSDSESDEYFDSFTIEEIQEMIGGLSDDVLPDVLDLLDEVEDEEALEEGVGRKMLQRNKNKKKRKFMSNSKAQLRKTAATRKKNARKNKGKNKRYYRANKQKIKSYQKSRNSAIKKGKHVVKKRRSAG